MVILQYTFQRSKKKGLKSGIHMEKLSKWIVKFRNVILVVAILLLIPSVYGYLKTDINYDLLSYLPASSESMKAQDILGDEFNLSSVDFLVLNNKTEHEAAKIKDQINKIDGVEKCIWRDDVMDITIPKEAIPDNIQEMLYSGDSTMMIVTFEEPTSSTRTMNAIAEIKKLSNEDCYLGGISAISEDTKDQTEHDTPIYAGIAVILCMVVLFLGLESTVAPIVFMLGMIFPIVYNFGTNIFLGQISYITKALAVVLQLAVTLDYSIFLLHRYVEEKKHLDNEEAMSKAIQATFTSITSSSVTTIAGFVALCVMQLTLGRDIGIVMAKGVVFGVLSTIFILPSLLMFFDKPIEKYTHKTIIHELKHQPLFVTKHYKKILIVFILVFIPFIYAQSHTTQYYDLISGMPEDFASIIGTNQLKDKFDMTTTHFVIVDDSLTTSQIQEMSNQIKDLDGIHNIISYEEFVGPGIPDSFKPSIVKEICQSDDHKLLVVNSDYKSATTELNNQLDQMDKIIHKYDPNALIGGEGSMTRDLINTTNVDFAFVNVLSVALIFLIVALTFKSFALPVILVLTIEFAISINMGIPFFTKTTLPFIASMVIGTIQLGATVDYAILLTTRFREELEAGKDLKEAARIATKRSSISIMTSGFSFFAACIGVSFFAKMDLIKSLVVLLARGALISVISILFVLPSLLIFFHKFIEKTTKGWPKERKVEL